MLVALTVRKLKPGSEDDFRKAFTPKDEEFPPGWKRFYAIRNLSDENEVVTFGFFDGTLEEMRASMSEGDYDERRAAADEFVESVGADGVYEILEERSME
jgi:heme-degrading monooxygenase HmoA